MRKLKLIWDFRGPNAQKIAEHHEIHLKEYIAINSISSYGTGTQTINELHTIAFLILDEAEMKPVRDALKPHRGQVHET